jgi:hypothetical protein
VSQNQNQYSRDGDIPGHGQPGTAHRPDDHRPGRLLKVIVPTAPAGFSLSQGERISGASVCRGSVVFTRPTMRHADDLPVVGGAVREAAARLSQRLGWRP